MRACSTRQESCAQTRPQAGREAIADCTCIPGAICDGRAMRSARLLTIIGWRSPRCACGDRSSTERAATRGIEAEQRARLAGRSTCFDARPSSPELRLAGALARTRAAKA